MCGPDKFLDASGWCNSCPEGGICIGYGTVTETIVTSAGYWRRYPYLASFKACEASATGSQMCEGGVNSTCRAGHRGPRCGLCEDGYGMASGLCARCQSPSMALNALLLSAAFIIFCSVTSVGLIFKLELEGKGVIEAAAESALLAIQGGGGGAARTPPSGTAKNKQPDDKEENSSSWMKEMLSLHHRNSASELVSLAKLLIGWLQTNSLAVQLNVSLAQQNAVRNVRRAGCSAVHALEVRAPSVERTMTSRFSYRSTRLARSSFVHAARRT